MAQKTLEKLDKDIIQLRDEVKVLRSFVIGTFGKDEEGQYSPQFVKKILKTVSETTPFIFKNKSSFLKMLRN